MTSRDVPGATQLDITLVSLPARDVQGGPPMIDQECRDCSRPRHDGGRNLPQPHSVTLIHRHVPPARAIGKSPRAVRMLEAVGQSWMAEERFSLLEDEGSEGGVFVIRTW